jgi:Putative MetA-pathway of phenol degradation
MVRTLILLLGVLLVAAGPAFSQGGPPFYTNDPGTPGHLNWEINVAYMPFLYSNQSVSHTPDLDINFGLGERIQLTYENAWLRVQNSSAKTKFGLGQSNPGVKWRFYGDGESGLSISTFPQLFLNNPNASVRRGITPPSHGFLLPLEISKKFGPVEVDYELGYQFVRKGPDAWLTGLVVGHSFTSKLEMDVELYAPGSVHPFATQSTVGVGGRYRVHSPVVLLFMAGRSLEDSGPSYPNFVGYFGLQFLLPARSYKSE